MAHEIIRYLFADVVVFLLFLPSPFEFFNCARGRGNVRKLFSYISSSLETHVLERRGCFLRHLVKEVNR